MNPPTTRIPSPIKHIVAPDQEPSKSPPSTTKEKKVSKAGQRVPLRNQTPIASVTTPTAKATATQKSTASIGKIAAHGPTNPGTDSRSRRAAPSSTTRTVTATSASTAQQEQLKAPNGSRPTSLPSTPRSKTSTTPSTSKVGPGHLRNPSGISNPLKPTTNSITPSSNPATALKKTQSNRLDTQQSPGRPSKPQFSTYQQDFTPLKQRPAHLQSTPRRAGGLAPAEQEPKYDPAQTRAQLHLLHLALIHQDAAKTQRAYLQSAKEKLSTRFDELYNLYTSTILLERQHRQTANLLALHAWTAGNVAALSRKLSVLTGILAELMRLTSPGADPRETPLKNHPGGLTGPTETSSSNHHVQEMEQQPGEYTKCVASFEQWAAWVRTVWKTRDAEANSNSTSAIDHDRIATAAPVQPRTNGQPLKHAGSLEATDYTPIEGLGDGFKATLRTLTTQLNAMHLKLQDMESGRPLSSQRTARHLEDIETKDPQLPATTTPEYVLASARALVDGMLEELQVMREVEFEVVIGEKVWLDARVRQIGAELEAF